uniref:Uncharacterized protein n=1 Tax=Anguilla anguilla TaxID=7936 RepID=A0A0E9SNM7_ANGAN
MIHGVWMRSVQERFQNNSQRRGGVSSWIARGILKRMFIGTARWTTS